MSLPLIWAVALAIGFCRLVCHLDMNREVVNTLGGFHNRL